jgi:RimJ/RimL family protein N-acetyltransferase/aryl carrier-like protein
MTAVVERSLRDGYREELADLLDVPPHELPDTARLSDDLALDSLGMMRLIAWLESHGVTVDHSRRPVTVGEVLTLRGRASTPGLSIHVIDDPTLDGLTAVPVRVHQPVDPLAPVLSTHALILTPVLPDDLGFLYGFAAREDVSYRWRYRGVPPPIERFNESLWKQVVVQFVARRSVDREPVGHLLAFAADPSGTHAHVGAVFLPEYAGTGIAAQGVATFLRYLFHVYPFRKLYLDIPGFNWPQVKSGEGQLFQVEGILRDHNYYAGRYWDEFLCAVYPDQFQKGG